MRQPRLDLRSRRARGCRDGCVGRPGGPDGAGAGRCGCPRRGDRPTQGEARRTGGRDRGRRRARTRPIVRRGGRGAGRRARRSRTCALRPGGRAREQRGHHRDRAGRRRVDRSLAKRDAHQSRRRVLLRPLLRSRDARTGQRQHRERGQHPGPRRHGQPPGLLLRLEGRRREPHARARRTVGPAWRARECHRPGLVRERDDRRHVR